MGVERVFPLHSPKVEKIEVTRRGKVRRAKLYYLRDRVGKETRIKEDLRRERVASIDESKIAQPKAEAPVEEVVEETTEAPAAATEAPVEATEDVTQEAPAETEKPSEE